MSRHDPLRGSLARCHAPGEFTRSSWWSCSAHFAASLEYFWIPVAALYLVVSTALVALFQPGRAGVVVAHAIALVLVALATPLLVTIH